MAAVYLRLSGCVGGCEEFMLSGWLVVLTRRIFYVGGCQLALQKNEIYEKILFSKIFVTRRKMRKNDIEESELNGLIRTYSTVLQDQTRFEKFNEKQ